MSNLRIKNKKLKREIERLRALSIGVNDRPVIDCYETRPTTLGTEIIFDGYEFDRMTTDDVFDFEKYIRRRLIDEMGDELVKHLVVETYRDAWLDRVICRGELNVIDKKEVD